MNTPPTKPVLRTVTRSQRHLRSPSVPLRRLRPAFSPSVSSLCVSNRRWSASSVQRAGPSATFEADAVGDANILESARPTYCPLRKAFALTDDAFRDLDIASRSGRGDPARGARVPVSSNPGHYADLGPLSLSVRIPLAACLDRARRLCTFARMVCIPTASTVRSAPSLRGLVDNS